MPAKFQRNFPIRDAFLTHIFSGAVIDFLIGPLLHAQHQDQLTACLQPASDQTLALKVERLTFYPLSAGAGERGREHNSP